MSSEITTLENNKKIKIKIILLINNNNLQSHLKNYFIQNQI